MKFVFQRYCCKRRKVLTILPPNYAGEPTTKVCSTALSGLSYGNFSRQDSNLQSMDYRCNSGFHHRQTFQFPTCDRSQSLLSLRLPTCHAPSLEKEHDLISVAPLQHRSKAKLNLNILQHLLHAARRANPASPHRQRTISNPMPQCLKLEGAAIA